MQAAERTLRSAEASALSDPNVLAEVAAEFVELQTALIQATAATTKALAQVTNTALAAEVTTRTPLSSRILANTRSRSNVDVA